MSRPSIRQILFVPPAPIVWANHIAAFERHGVQVQTTQTLSSDELGQGLAAGRWDIGIGVMDNVIAWNAERRAGLQIVAQLENSTVMGFYAVSDCTSLQQAAQRPIAVDSTTNGFVLVLYRALARAGIDWRSCRYDAVGGVRHRFEALSEGRAVSTILVPPFDDMARAKGFNRLWSGAEVAPAYPGVVACAGAGWITVHSEAVVRYLRALVDANRWGSAPENRASALKALVDARYTVAAAERLVRDAVPDLRPSLAGWEEIASLRRECGLMPEPAPTASVILNEGPLQAALAAP